MRRVRKRLLAVPAVAAALFLAAPAPACALPLTVTTTGPVSFDGGLHLLNLYTGTAFSCVSSHLDAVAQSLPPLFQFNGASISGCTGLFNLQVDVTPKFFPWEMSAYSIGNGEATGSITGVYFTVDTSDGCQAEISGSAGAAERWTRATRTPVSLHFPAVRAPTWR